MTRRGVAIRSWSVLKLRLVIACMAALGALAVGAQGASAGYVLVPSSFGSFSLNVGIAVDNSTGASAGDVYQADLGAGTLDKFNAAGLPENYTAGPNEGTNTLSSGAGFSPNNGPWAVAVDSATGDIYTTIENPLPGRVDRFHATGEEVTLPAGAFIPKIGDAGVTEAQVNEYEPSGVAVDNSCFYQNLTEPECKTANPSNGDVYIADRQHGIVYKFTAEGEFLSVLPVPAVHFVTLAVDSNGNVYVDAENNKIEKYSPTGTSLGTFGTATNGSFAVTVDQSTGDVFVYEFSLGDIVQYSSAGTEISNFGGGVIANPDLGVAVNNTTHAVYVASLSPAFVYKFEQGEAPPKPITGPPTEITGTTAKLHGTMDPESLGASEEGFHFAFNSEGPCTGPGSRTTEPPGAPASRSNEAVESEATGLSPKTPYKFCLVATSSFGETPSENEGEFTTPAAAPVIASESVVERTTTSLKVEATINPGGAATTCEVQYGTTEAYGLTAPCTVEGTGIAGVPVTAELTGLTANTEYHFQFVAYNEIAPEPTGVAGGDAVGKTKPLVECETGEANPVGSTTATLKGIVKTGEEAATYFVEYGETTAYGSTTEVKEIPAGPAGPHPVELEAKNLAPGTPYHYQLVCSPAAEPGLKITGGDKELTTLPAKPVIAEEFSENEGRHSVSLGAEINPENSETTYFFEYGKTEAYGSKTSGGAIPKGVVVVEAGPEAVTELEPGTTYHYRVVATNGAGTVEGPDQTFTTTAPKLAIIEAESSAQVTQTTATINATVNPNGLQTSYILEVGTEVEGHILYTPSFGEVGSGTLGVELGFALTGLQPGTTYHYRIVAQNEDGTVFGADQTFATPGFPPVILTPPPVQIVPTPPQPKPPRGETRPEKYRHAVALCHKKPKKKRAACLRKAKKQFGPVTKKHKKKK